MIGVDRVAANTRLTCERGNGQTLAEGGRVELRGFGVFSIRTVPRDLVEIRKPEP